MRKKAKELLISHSSLLIERNVSQLIDAVVQSPFVFSVKKSRLQRK